MTPPDSVHFLHLQKPGVNEVVFPLLPPEDVPLHGPLIVLSGSLRPDKATIARISKRYRSQVKAVLDRWALCPSSPVVTVRSRNEIAGHFSRSPVIQCSGEDCERV